jgi:hypothetical protein
MTEAEYIRLLDEALLDDAPIYADFVGGGWKEIQLIAHVGGRDPYYQIRTVELVTGDRWFDELKTRSYEDLYLAWLEATGELLPREAVNTRALWHVHHAANRFLDDIRKRIGGQS